MKMKPMHQLIAGLHAGAFFFAGLAASQATQISIVDTSAGPIEGIVRSSDKVKEFLGIPFAKSPPERFGPPIDAEPWTEPLRANQTKPACFQQFNYPERTRNFIMQVYSSPIPEQSEDCLYLNVWAPEGPAPTPDGYPVFFWIYGGNLEFGHAAYPPYYGAHLAENQKVVVVTINYRVNVFGFPNSPAISAPNQNPGFLDQRKALGWVQENIASFGGDPTRVTIAGQSAGGWSVKQLLAVPPATSPLPYSRAIMLSPASGVTGDFQTWQSLVKALNCTRGIATDSMDVETLTAAEAELDCVRKMPAAQIKDIIEHESYTFAPVADGVTRAKNVTATIESHTFVDVPIIVGSTADDGSAFAIIFTGADPSSPQFSLIEAALTASSFQCPAAGLAETLGGAGYDVHRYIYAADFPEYYPFAGAGAFHAAEIDPIFGTGNASRPEMEFAGNSVQGMVGEFVRGETNGVMLGKWPKVKGKNEDIMVLDRDSNRVESATKVDADCQGTIDELVADGL